MRVRDNKRFSRQITSGNSRNFIKTKRIQRWTSTEDKELWDYKGLKQRQQSRGSFVQQDHDLILTSYRLGN